jgi:formate hydrogenlyase transcriptional activator
MTNAYGSARDAEALLEEAERLRHLVENAADAFFVVDPQGHFVDANQRACDDSGYSRGALLQMCVWDLAVDFTPAHFASLVRQMTAGPLTVQARHRRKDGTTYPVEVRVCLVESRGHRLVLGLVRDVTERERAVDALRKSEQRFHSIFEHSNDAAFVIDPATDAILDVNSRACAMLAYSREELLALPSSAVHPHERPRRLAFVQSVLDRGGGWTDELTCLTKAGERIPTEVSASIIDAGGRTAIIALVRDIRARKRAELALKEHAARLEDLVAERTAALRQSEERHRVLLEINNAIVSNLDRESLFAAITRALGKVLPFDRASLTFPSVAKNVATVHALAGLNAVSAVPLHSEIPLAGSRIGWVLEHRRAVAIGDLSSDPRGPESRLLEEGLRSAIVAPLLRARGAIGTVNVASSTPDHYSDQDAEFLTEVGRQVALAVENMLAYEEIARLKARVEQENLYLQEEIKTQHNFAEIVGQSAAIKKVLQAVETVAPTLATVLVTGETGTGKELVARAVHELSPRRAKPMVTVNCAALPAGLIESELFGYEKGAFTGAVARRIGRFELAHGGSIFLDEIGDLPMDLQAKLLRVLQDGQFERVGASHTLTVDVRVVAATNEDLEAAIEAGKFRADLYYRLNVFPIGLPPLRERKDDIPILVRHLVMKHRTRLGKPIDSIPRAVMEALVDYAWPGNVRELENVIERAVILSRGSQLELGDWLPRPRVTRQGAAIASLEEVERGYILDVLETTHWRVDGPKGAARLLALKPTTLEARMKKLGIRRPH